jgi:pSer/pThr/pTyr-binding forkhead associated (FHA) protein
MSYKQGQNTIDDTTPPMGAMPVQLVDAGMENTQHTHNSTPVSDYISKYYLVSAQDGNRVEIAKFPFIIGRLSTCDLSIKNKKVSREHALILKANNTIVICNENSLNGICVNNHKVKRVVLQDGDEISIATEKYIFEVQRVLAEDELSDEHQNEELITGNEPQEALFDNENPTAEIDQQIEAPGLPAKKPLSKKSKLIGFALITTLVIASCLFAYQYYLQKSNESRVFVVSAENEKVDGEKASSTDMKAADEQKPDATTDSAQAMSTDPDKPVQPEKSTVAESDQDNKAVTNIATKSTDATIKTTKTNNQVRTDYKLTDLKKKTIAAEKSTKKTVSVKKPTYQKRALTLQKDSQEKIRQAVNLYHAGNFNQSSDTLHKIANSKRHQSEYRVQAKELNARIIELNNYYETGNTAFASNNKEEAFDNWEKLLNQHKAYFPTTQSFYVGEIKDKVATEYEQSGNQAYVKEEWKKAYQNWRKAVAIRPKEDIQKSINLMDAEIRELYRTGYRYETVNISRAMEYWESVMQKAPRDHDYYIKAAAKIQWYKNRR